MAQTVLVTGGSGFVAGWCVVELLKRGYTVRTTVRGLDKGDAIRAAVATQVDPGDRLTFAAGDLTSDAGWDAAMAGCAYVLHVASPMGRSDDHIGPARDGTLRVLRAAVAAGVKRVVYTSSTAACAPRLQGPDSLNDESQWTDLADPDLNDYRRSKAIAERAAWEFMADHGGSTELASVLPSAIFGPVLSDATLGSVMVIGRILKGMPGVPKVGFSIVDVRDLAVAHVLAMESADAAGQRFIACGEFRTMIEIAKTLRAALGDAASRTPTRQLPNTVVRLAAKAQPELRALVPTLGRKHAFSSAKAQAVLGWRPRPVEDTVVDCATSLIAVGAI